MSTRPRPLAPLRRARFRAVWLAECCVVVADQVFLIALTLLVIDLSGAGAQVGTVLATASVPLALLLPLGGWLGDRVPAERILLATNSAQALLIGALAALVLAGDPPLWSVYSLVAVMGAVDGLHYPAAFSFAPRAVPPEELAAANSLMQGAETVSDLAGPVVAAVAVAAVGLGSTFAAVAALSALAALLLVRAAGRVAAESASDGAQPPPLAELGAGFRLARTDPLLRSLLLILFALSLLAVGPLIVGLAALAETRFGGADALSLIFAGFGVGTLAGLVLAATLPPPRHRGLVLIVTTALLGVGIAGIGLTQSREAAMAVAAAMGLAVAFLDISLLTWLQESIPQDVLARVMSVLVLAEVAADPISFAVAGAMLPLGVTALFAVSGGLLVLVALTTWVSGALHALR